MGGCRRRAGSPVAAADLGLALLGPGESHVKRAGLRKRRRILFPVDTVQQLSDDAEDLGTYDYAKTLSELQDTIQIYAKESQNEDLLEKSNTLFQQKENIRADLSQMLQLLQEKKNQ